MPEDLDFLMRPVLLGAVAHWEVYAEDHVDLAAFKLANAALSYQAENGARAAAAPRK